MRDRTGSIATGLLFASLAMMVTAGLLAALERAFSVVFALGSVYAALVALLLLTYSETRL